MRKTLTIAEAAERLGVHTRTIRRYIAAGHIQANRMGPRLIRVSIESLDRFENGPSLAA